MPVTMFSSRRLRLAGLFYGLLVFAWLGPEDNAVWPPVLLGLCGALLLTVRLLLRWVGGRRLQPAIWLPVAALAGLLTGLGMALLASGLMFFKTALHAHEFPDFPPLLILAVLERAPAWGAAGLLAGAGVGLALKAVLIPERDGSASTNSVTKG